MKAQDIITHLMRYLPEYTGLFSSTINPSSVTVVGTTVTMGFASPHGLSTNAEITVKGSLIENPIFSIVDDTDYITFTTTNDHDLTEADDASANLTSASTPAVDNDYSILEVPNRRTFTIASFPDVGLGDVILNEPLQVNNINGRFAVTVTSTTEFTYQLANAFAVDPTVKSGTSDVVGGIRISGGSSILRLQKHYDEQGYKEAWAFVVLGESAVSKDRNVQDDAVLNQKNLNDWAVNMNQNPAVFVFMPKKESSGIGARTGREARDTIEDIRPALYKAVVGDSFDTGFEHDPISVLIPVSDDMAIDNDAYLVHRFLFQQVAQITSEDRVDKSEDVAMRDVELTYLDVFTDSGNILMTAEIDLDDNPL